VKSKCEVKFIGIDDWNRPVFKDIEKESYYGSLNTLFGYDATEDIVLKTVLSTELLLFGNSFNCEPWGDKPATEISIVL